MKNKILRISICVLAIIGILFANMFCINNSNAANLNDWKNEVRSYYSCYGFNVNGTYEERWLLYDITGKYKDLYCVRSGDRQNETYTEFDLYNLPEAEKNQLFASEANYKQFMWALENMYLYGDTNSNKLANYHNLIGASSLPYGDSNVIQNSLYHQIKGKIGEVYNVKRSEQLIKVVQNEALLQLVKQTKTRVVDIQNLYGRKVVKGVNVGEILTGAPRDYAQKIMNTLLSTTKSANYSVNNKNKGFYSAGYDGKVAIDVGNDGADWNNGISSRFAVYNKYKATITGVNVYINGNKLTSGYQVIDMSGADITSQINNLLTNSASESVYNFKVKVNNPGADDTIKVELNVDYGYITKASLFKPTEDNSANGLRNQYMINVSRQKEVGTVSTEKEEEIKTFDLALTKKITNVYFPSGTQVGGANGLGLSYNRLYSIDVDDLKSGKSNTARYIMDKSLVDVEENCIVTYKINVYNEGNLDGYAEKITDYLPEGLVLAPDSAKNAQYGWVKNADGTISTDYLSRAKDVNNVLTAFDGNSLSGNENTSVKYVELECKVVPTEAMKQALQNHEKVEMNNRAEISKYGYFQNGVFVEANVNGVDIDSIENSVLANSGTTSGSGLIDKIKDKIAEAKRNAYFMESYTDKAVVAYEDDDDIERLKLQVDARRFDLALRKWIINVDGTSYEESRTPSQVDKYINSCDAVLASNCLAEGTLNYDNSKDAIQLQPGSIVTYRLAIFNEGQRNGFAEEITDYLPQWLEFVEQNPTNIANGWVATKNADGTTIVKTELLSRKNGKEPVLVTSTTGEPLGAESLDRIRNELKDEYNSNVIMNILQNYGYKMTGRKGFESMKYVDIVCKVSEDVNETTYLTNRAEITKYGYYDNSGNFVEASDKEVDLDSEQNTIKDDLNLDSWYSENYDEVNPKDTYPGVQDDDDFETVFVKIVKGKYTLKIRKISTIDGTAIDGISFKVNNKVTEPTVNGLTTVAEKVFTSKELNVVDKYTISEINLGKSSNYATVKEPISIYVKKSSVGEDYKVSEVSFAENEMVTSKKVVLDDDTEAMVVLSLTDNVITVTIPNKPTGFDLALCKFISSVNGEKLEGAESREPVVDTSKLVSGEATTAKYYNTKLAKLVSPQDIVEYTLRIYNEGKLDGYATMVMDDIPEGVEMVAPEYTEDNKPANINAEYRWVMYKEYVESEEQENLGEMIRYNNKTYVSTTKVEEAELVVTDYLSKENGEAMLKASGVEDVSSQVNPNLLKAFDYTTGKFTEDNYRDLKIEFRVKPSNEEGKEIINYAQITEDSDITGGPVKDRDSTPNEWNDGEDDQDIEKIKVRYFDLALYKWVSSAIVTEDGKTTEYGSKHTQDNKENVVNVAIPKDKLSKVSVKFKYQIKVENQGQLEGYAKEIKDHIPEGLKFVAEDNIEYGWVLGEDGTITTDYLKDTLLKPGETAEVTVVLTWINGSDNLGKKVNFAEISEDYNEYGTPDKDSTPDNFTGKPVEDDEDGDEVVLQVRTGEEIFVTYATLGIAVMAIIAGGVVCIKKFVM